MSSETLPIIKEILVVRELGPRRYYLILRYEEGDAGNATGSVYVSAAARGVTLQPYLTTNDSLRSFWVSPSGAVWTGSSSGRVATTAPVRFLPPQAPPVGYLREPGSPPWHVTMLPKVRLGNLPPSITAIAGTSDDDVWVGSYAGHIFHWDGVEWSQVHDGPDEGDGTIKEILARGADDVFAVGSNETLLHFDGSGWRSILPPGVLDRSEAFTGIHASNGEVLVSAAGPGPVGRILKGGPAGFAQLCVCDMALRGIASVDDRLILPAGPKGIFELVGASVVPLKEGFDAVAATSGAHTVFVIEAIQSRPSYIEFEPASADRPWRRVLA